MDIGQFGATLSEAAQLRRAGELLAREAASQFEQARRLADDGRRKGFSIVRAISCMANGGLKDGYEREVSEEYSRRAGGAHDPSRIRVPFGALADRAMTVGSASQAGYLAGGLDVTLGEALRGYSVAFDAGISTLSGLRSNVQIAQEAAEGTGYWIAEVGTATASAPTFAGVTLSPKHAGGYVEISRQLLTQAPGADAFVGRSLRRTIGKLLDAAIINGTGTGDLQGFVGMTGLGTLVGTGLDHADLLAEQEAVSNAYVSEANHKFVGSPDVRELLGARAVGTSAGIAPFCWQDDRVLNRPAYATPACGTQTIVHGDFSQAVLATWGPDAFELQLNPYAGFQSGIVGVRVLISCDLAVLNVGALRVISAIT